MNKNENFMDLVLVYPLPTWDKFMGPPLYTRGTSYAPAYNFANCVFVYIDCIYNAVYIVDIGYKITLEI